MATRNSQTIINVRAIAVQLQRVRFQLLVKSEKQMKNFPTKIFLESQFGTMFMLLNLVIADKPCETTEQDATSQYFVQKFHGEVYICTYVVKIYWDLYFCSVFLR